MKCRVFKPNGASLTLLNQGFARRWPEITRDLTRGQFACGYSDFGKATHYSFTESGL
jgi:hypothetical protein